MAFIISCLVEVYMGDEKIDFGYSPSRTDDNNDFLKFKLKKNTSCQIVISDQAQPDYSKKLILKCNEKLEQDYEFNFK